MIKTALLYEFIFLQTLTNAETFQKFFSYIDNINVLPDNLHFVRGDFNFKFMIETSKSSTLHGDEQIGSNWTSNTNTGINFNQIVHWCVLHKI